MLADRLTDQSICRAPGGLPDTVRAAAIQMNSTADRDRKLADRRPLAIEVAV
jgi:hypothetical protein